MIEQIQCKKCGEIAYVQIGTEQCAASLCYDCWGCDEDQGTYDDEGEWGPFFD